MLNKVYFQADGRPSSFSFVDGSVKSLQSRSLHSAKRGWKPVQKLIKKLLLKRLSKLSGKSSGLSGGICLRPQSQNQIRNVSDFIAADDWPCSSPHLNPFDYKFLSLLQAMAWPKAAQKYWVFKAITSESRDRNTRERQYFPQCPSGLKDSRLVSSNRWAFRIIIISADRLHMFE